MTGPEQKAVAAIVEHIERETEAYKPKADFDLLSTLRALDACCDEVLTRFMTESNAIEGETGLNPNDLKAARRFLSKPMTAKSLLACHKLLAGHLGVDWAGKWRECGVKVGEHVAPPHQDVPKLMRAFFRELPGLPSWEAHNRFQKIHPFRDLNGRTGRLIWLHKAIDEGYTGRIGFLHCFYYQTLSREPHPGKERGQPAG